MSAHQKIYRPSIQPRRLCFVWLLLFAAVGCRPKQKGWQSEHFVYQTDESDDEACEKVMETLERDYLQVRTRFALPTVRDKMIYHKLPADQGLKGTPCPSFAGACARRATLELWSNAVLRRHELVHLYFSVLGGSHPVLAEGVATALACRVLPARPDWGEWQDVPSSDDDYEFSSENANSDGRLYAAAAAFVAQLVRSYGEQVLVELYRRAKSGSNESVVEVFEELTQDNFATFWETSVRAAIKDPEAGCLRMTECQDPLPEGDFMHLQPSCDGTGVFFGVPAQGEAWHALGTLESNGLRTASCDFESPLPHQASVRPWPDLDLGMQVFKSSSDFFVGASREFISVLHQTLQPGRSCSEAAAEPLVVPAGPVSFHLPPGEGLYVSFLGAVWTDVAFETEGQATVEWCGACDEECALLSPLTAESPVSWFADGNVFRLTDQGGGSIVTFPLASGLSAQ